MKIRCPGCSKVLDIPESAAGKVVKCPCGKQLRAPAGAGAPATPAQPAAPAQRPAPQQPVAQRPAAAAPVARPAQPVAPQAVPAQPIPAQPGQSGAYPWQPAKPEPPNDMFSDLTEGDLQGVKAVSRPGATASGGPRGLGGTSVYDEAGMSPDDGNRRNFLLIAGNMALGLGAIGAGGGLIFWDLTREEDAADEGGGVSFRRRRKTPLGAGITLIIAGVGWMARGLFGGDD